MAVNTVHTIDWRIDNDRLMPFSARGALRRGAFALRFRLAGVFLAANGQPGADASSVERSGSLGAAVGVAVAPK